MSRDGDGIMAENRVGNEAEVVQYCAEKTRVAIFRNPTRDSSHLPGTPFAQNSTPIPSSEPLTVEGHTANIVQRTSPSGSFVFDEETLAVAGNQAAMPEKPIFATGVFRRVAFAAFLAIVLQWGTTGASVLIYYSEPPTGVGCRASTFIAYCALGTIAFGLLLSSSMFAHLARRQDIHERRSDLKTFIGYTAALTRWLGRLIAFTNCFLILVSCFLLLGGVYENCFCFAFVLGHDLITLQFAPTHSVKYFYTEVLGTAMAVGASVLYSFVIYFATPVG